MPADNLAIEQPSDAGPFSGKEHLDLATAHPELHHYTSIAGLKGIWERQMLWATQYSYLNDSAEVVLLKDFLKDALTEELATILRGHQKSGLKNN
jgi:hypothetical protein